MSVIKVAILGFGTVGEGFYRTIQSHAGKLQAILGKRVEVAAVLIKNKQKKRNIDGDVLITSDFEDILKFPQLDVVVEAIVGKEVPFLLLQKAIQKGCHVITANKEMFASHGKELFQLAEDHKVSLGFEATVGGGIPIIQTLRQLLKVNRVQQVQGIINGTSNFILTEMREKKQPFAAALKLAQENGYAEADPTNDVEGFDAFYKLMILSRISFGGEPDWNDVEIEGITSITSRSIETAGRLGLRFKHIASVSIINGQIKAAIRPVLVGKSHPFYHVEGVQNAINIHSDIVGSITLQGPGAGMFPSASAVIEDLVFVCQNQQRNTIKQLIESDYGQNGVQANEYWLIEGLKKTIAGVSVIEPVDESAVVIRASETEITHLAKMHKELLIYPILDHELPARLSEKEAVPVSL